jgi:AcrR family transcriptional regulator
MTKPAAMAKDQVERVLEAAARLFREKGFAATTVREIAKAAGMLPGSLHYRYASKEAILLAVVERAILRATDAVREAIATSRDPVERVRLALRAHLRLLLSGDDAIYVLLYDWRSITGEARAAIVRLRDRYEALWDGLLYEAAGAGRLRPRVDLKLVRLLGFGAINWVAQWFRQDGERTPEEIADAFWAFVAFGVLADERRPDDVDGALRSLSAFDLGVDNFTTAETRG